MDICTSWTLGPFSLAVTRCWGIAKSAAPESWWDHFGPDLLGAVAAGLASLGVALLVLRRTLVSDREQASRQRTADRALATEQRAHEVELDRKREQMSAFADLTGSLVDLTEFREGVEPEWHQIIARYQRWGLYAAPAEMSFFNAVGRLLAQVNKDVTVATRAFKPDARRKTFELNNGPVAVGLLLKLGRIWHQDESRRAAVLAKLDEKYEKRYTSGPDGTDDEWV